MMLGGRAGEWMFKGGLEAAGQHSLALLESLANARVVAMVDCKMLARSRDEGRYRQRRCRGRAGGLS